MFELSHSEFSTEPTAVNHAANVATMVANTLGSWVYVPADSSPDIRYDSQNMKNIPLSSITNGQPKVIFLNTDGCRYPHSVTNLSDGTLYPLPPSAVQAGVGLYGRWFTTTPEMEQCAGNVLLNCFDPSAKVKFLQQASRTNNAQVKAVLAQSPEVNRFVMDWYTESDGELPIDLIIKSNY